MLDKGKIEELDKEKKGYLKDKFDHYVKSFTRESLNNMKSIESDNLYVASYSTVQDAFHVESVSDMIETNTDGVFSKNQLSYIPFFFGTYEECHSYCECLEEILYAAYDQDL